eukprot:CAMPEP_0197678406 /NCGR_PEP_ID=MMETSP1338-20131121/89961_1 /TAXON_ID=43686 ORGANISM="Pelagodinium beii, Strain RCC1491" /NCGR_SAMPLE_ID=MMETSP1338 /ASSEMBLY_ACC=CAM_ASM_000754 /LENGTH=119 /DNA_ID=CAMNT_0043259345 /DNA_START=68 /DNA_END=427 /DNA_ORIENTATION=+
MVKNIRVTYRRRHSYNTKSNRIRVVKTPGGKLVAQYLTKSSNAPLCGAAGCNKRLQGIPRIRPKQFKNIAKSKRTVNRAYGGSLCAGCVRDRIMRAFMIEEQKIVKKVVIEQQKKKSDK